MTNLWGHAWFDVDDDIFGRAVQIGKSSVSIGKTNNVCI